MVRSKFLFIFMVLVFAAGCASSTKKVVIWESSNIPRTYKVLGPVSITEEYQEDTTEMIGGLASYFSKGEMISEQLPPEIKKSLQVKAEVYKEDIFEKLSKKAGEYGADAVMGVEYSYIPPFASFSDKARVTAEGTMIEYKDL